MIDFKFESVDDIIEGYADIDEREQRGECVFSQWVQIGPIGRGTIRIVKPAKPLVDKVNEVIGYPITSLIPKRCADGSYNWIVGTTEVGGVNFRVDAIACNTTDARYIYKLDKGDKDER